MPDTHDDDVLLAIDNRVATITLNRPGARNALSAAVLRALPQRVAEADGRDDVDVMILTGADPAFCAGLDLKELGSGRPLLRTTPPASGASATAASSGGSIRRGPLPARAKPLIGAVNGVAVTGGLELALACDLLIASEHARFADTHARIGVQPDWGLTVLLPQAIGLRRAREMSATGNYIDADTALAWGLVNHVVAHDELLPFCRKLGADIVSNDQAGVQRIFATYDEGAMGTGADAWAAERAAAKGWQSDGIDPAEIERRRQTVIDRGRSQV